MKTNTIITAFLLLSGSVSYAGFECQEPTGQISVTAEHESMTNYYDRKEKLGKLLISTSGKDEVQMSTHVEKWNTRVGSQYAYKLPVDVISFSISEFTNLVDTPNCSHGGRITCDYNWASSYVGYLTFNGKSYELACTAK